MTKAATENQIAALRAEIRRTGETAARLGLAILAAGLCLVPFFGLAAIVVSFVGALAAGAGYRWLRYARVRRQLAAVPPAARYEALSPLAGEAHLQIRQLAGSLMRDRLLDETELAPAFPPPARGDEVSAAEGEAR